MAALAAPSPRARAAVASALLLPSLLAAACQFPVSIGDLPVVQRQAAVRLAPVERADILLVVDNSPSLGGVGGRQERFAQALRESAALLPALGSVHFATVTTDLGAGPLAPLGCRPGGDGGSLRATANPNRDARCPGAAPGGGIDGDDFLDLDFTARRDNLMGRTLEDALACLALAGGDGCAFEQPLEAMRRALLAGARPESGFLRQDAVLVVIFLTDEDDCSAEDASAVFDVRARREWGPMGSYRCAAAGLRFGLPAMPLPGQPTGGPLPQPGIDGSERGDGLRPLSRYLELFGSQLVQPMALKADAGNVILAGFTGPPEPLELVSVAPSAEPSAEQPPCEGPLDGASCQLALRHACRSTREPSLFADPAPRLARVLRGAAHSYAASACEPDHRRALADILGLADAVQGTTGCLGAPLLDAARPTCRVTDSRTVANDTVTTPIFACRDRDDAPPCWRVTVDPACAQVVDPRTGGSAAYRLQIVRGATPAPPGTVTVASCDTP